MAPAAVMHGPTSRFMHLRAHLCGRIVLGSDRSSARPYPLRHGCCRRLAVQHGRLRVTGRLRVSSLSHDCIVVNCDCGGNSPGPVGIRERPEQLYRPHRPIAPIPSICSTPAAGPSLHSTRDWAKVAEQTAPVGPRTGLPKANRRRRTSTGDLTLTFNFPSPRQPHSNSFLAPFWPQRQKIHRGPMDLQRDRAADTVLGLLGGSRLPRRPLQLQRV